jgi:cytochrome bd-type quinol oxidase subunit 2
MDLNWTTLLPLVFMAVMGLALLAYVVLDGYDLGRRACCCPSPATNRRT